jgi:competence protein ComEC
MNFLVLYFERFPGALWENLQLDFYQVILMYAAIACLMIWWQRRRTLAIYFKLASLFGFACLRSLSFYKASVQQTLIVYNVPSFRAIEFIKGRRYSFVADNQLKNDPSLINFHIKPSRIWHRVAGNESREILLREEGAILFCGKRILLIDQSRKLPPSSSALQLDVVILSGNVKIPIADIVNRFSVKRIVFDSSNSSFTIKRWEEQCRQLAVPCYSVADKGAFVMNLN